MIEYDELGNFQSIRQYGFKFCARQLLDYPHFSKKLKQQRVLVLGEMVEPKYYKRSGDYIQRHEEMLASPAYRGLSTVARCLLEEFQRVYRPGRNGQLSICTSRAKVLLGVSEPTAMKAFNSLVAHGFLALKNHECWIERKAREYALTFEPLDNREPTDEWKDWAPQNPYPIPGRKKLPTKKQGQRSFC